jgi:hypothetical protein
MLVLAHNYLLMTLISVSVIRGVTGVRGLIPITRMTSEPTRTNQSRAPDHHTFYTRSTVYKKQGLLIGGPLLSKYLFFLHA